MVPDQEKNDEKELYLAFCPKCKLNERDRKNGKCLCVKREEETVAKNSENNATTKNSNSKETDNKLTVNTSDLQKSAKNGELNSLKKADKTMIKDFTEEIGSVYKLSKIDTTGDICLSRSNESTLKDDSLKPKDSSFEDKLRNAIEEPQEDINSELISQIGDKICGLVEKQNLDDSKGYDVFIFDKDGNIGTYELSRIEENDEKPSNLPEQVLKELGYKKDDKPENAYKGDNVEVIFGNPLTNPGKVTWKFKSQSYFEESFDFDAYEKERRREILLNLAKEAEDNPEEMFCLCRGVELTPIRVPEIELQLCACCKADEQKIVNKGKNTSCIICDSESQEYRCGHMPKENIPVNIQCDDNKICQISENPEKREIKDKNKTNICRKCGRLVLAKKNISEQKELHPCTYCLKIGEECDAICCYTEEEKRMKKIICGEVSKITESKISSIISKSETSRILPLENVSETREKSKTKSLSMKLPTQSSIISTQKVDNDKTFKEKSKTSESSKDLSKSLTLSSSSKKDRSDTNESSKELSKKSSKHNTLSTISGTGITDKSKSPQKEKEDLKSKSSGTKITAPLGGIKLPTQSSILSTQKVTKDESKSSKNEIEIVMLSKASSDKSNISKKESIISKKDKERKSAIFSGSTITFEEVPHKELTVHRSIEHSLSRIIIAEEERMENEMKSTGIKKAPEPVKIVGEQSSLTNKSKRNLTTTTSKISESEPKKVKNDSRLSEGSTAKSIKTVKISVKPEDISSTKKSYAESKKSIAEESVKKSKEAGESTLVRTEGEIIKSLFNENEIPKPKTPIYITNFKGSKISLNPEGKVARLIHFFEQLMEKNRKKRQLMSNTQERSDGSKNDVKNSKISKKK